MTYSMETEAMMQRLKDQGFNIWAMLGIFKRRSKLAPAIPDEVIQEVCKEYFKRAEKIRADFPYFLTVLQRKSEDYFARQNVLEGERFKKEPARLKITIG